MTTPYRWHNSPKTGKPARCYVDPHNPRTRGCPLGGQHYNSEEEAYDGIKKEYEDSLIPQPDSISNKIKQLFSSSDSIPEVKNIPRGSSADNHTKVKEIVDMYATYKGDELQNPHSFHINSKHEVAFCGNTGPCMLRGLGHYNSIELAQAALAKIQEV